jgi:hypothetical protein
MTNLAQLVIETALTKGISISIGSDGSVQIGGSSTPSDNPQYVSDTVPELSHGEVTRQIKKLKKIGTTMKVRAHAAESIRSAMNRQGWGSSVSLTDEPYVFLVERTKLARHATRRR